MTHRNRPTTDRTNTCRVRRLLTVAVLLLLCIGWLMACHSGGAPADTEGGSGNGNSPVGDTAGRESSDTDPTDSSAGTEGDPTDTDASRETEAGEAGSETAETTTSDQPTELPATITRPPVGTSQLSQPDADNPYSGLMIAAVHGTGKKGAEAVVDHGFVRLYNNTTQAISLDGLALYYKTEGTNPYVSFAFPAGASVPAGGSYLVRANAPADIVEANLIMKITAFDAEWDVHIDNKEVRLLLAPAGLTVEADADITSVDQGISVFYASTLTPLDSVYAVDDLTRSKIAVRTAMEAYSGYHLVNLTRATTADLQALCPTTADGRTNQVVASRLSEVVFSHAAGVYPQAFDLTLYAPEGYTIYYTTDGSNPADKSNSSRKKYTGKLRMADSSSMPWGPTTEEWYECPPSVERQIGGRVIKAYAVKGNDQTSVYTNTYFITDDLAAYGVTVMSISMPVEEIMGDGFYANYNPTGIITDTRPRGMATLEVFDPTGQRVGNSFVELAVSGNGSSHTGMKSLRVYYKSKNNQTAGLQSDLHYDLFQGLARDVNGEAITSFSRLVLRNSGNDVGHSYIRDAYMQRVCAGLNVDTMSAATTLVFINGEFWGVYNARERYSPEYVESHYGVDKNNVTVIESDYAALVYGRELDAPYIVASGEEGDEKDFNDLVEYIRTHDLTDPTHYAYVCDRLDMDSVMDLWIARLYFNARDFPENNIKLWRNKNPDDPSGMDTKWHAVLLDMDMGLAYFPTGDENDTGETASYFDSFFNEETVFGFITVELLKNEEFRNGFLARFYVVLTEVLTEENLSPVLEAYIAERTPLMALQEDRWLYNGASVYTWREDCEDMRRFVANRNRYALQYLLERFDVTEEELKSLSGK